MLKEKKLEDILGDDVLFEKIDRYQEEYDKNINFNVKRNNYMMLRKKYEELGMIISKLLTDKLDTDFANYAYKSEEFEQFLKENMMIEI